MDKANEKATLLLDIKEFQIYFGVACKMDVKRISFLSQEFEDVT